LIAAVAVVAVIVLATMGASSKHGLPSLAGPVHAPNGTLQGRAFETSVIAGWRIRTRQNPHGAVRYQASSTAAALDSAGVPPAGGVGITIDDVPASFFTRGSSRAPDSLTVLRMSAGTPRGAKGVARVAAPRRTTLGGAEAAEEAFTYSYRGRGNVQVDVVAQHGGRSLLIELDAEPGLAKPSQQALELLASGWRWG
jgi:hypothetical protein